jgi:hypothetical protein
MGSLACFTAVGLLLGFFVPLPAFAIFCVVALAVYGSLTGGFRGLERAYTLALTAAVLQLGYVLSVVAQVLAARYFKPAKTDASASTANHDLTGDGRTRRESSPPDSHSSGPAK